MKVNNTSWIDLDVGHTHVDTPYDSTMYHGTTSRNHGDEGWPPAAFETHVLDIPKLNEAHDHSHGTHCNTANVVSQVERWTS